MLKGITLQELMGMVAEIEKTKNDYVLDTRNLRMSQDKTLEVSNVGAFAIRPVAHDQLAARLQIPKPYYDRMLEKSPALLANNVNYWFDAAPETRMVRTVKTDMRAFLSDRFYCLDNIHLMKATLPVLADHHVDVKSAELTERKLYLQVSLMSLEGEVKKGDIVRVGATVSNSEVGFGQWSFSSFIERLECTNGLIRASEFKRRHVGRRVEGDETGLVDTSVWSRETIQADLNALTLKAQDSIRAALSEGALQKQLEDLRRAAGLEIPTKHLEPVVKNVTRRVGLSEGESEGVMAALLEEGDMSMWGLVNAITRQAHETDSFDRNIELQEAGGKVLDLSPAEWKVLTKGEALAA